MEKYAVGSWHIDVHACTLTNQKECKHVEPRCMELLLLLIEAKGDVVPRTRIMDTLWQGRYVSDHALNNLVASLRKYLRDDDISTYIKTIPKRGYQLVVPAQPVSSVSSFPPSSLPDDATVIEETDNSPAIQKNSILKQQRSRFFIYSAIAIALIAMGSLGLFLNESVHSENEVRSIAVMPFDVFDRQPQSEDFANGLSEEIIHQLSTSSTLDVVSRSSSFAPANTNLDIKQVAQSLNATYLLEGSVRKQRDLLRITTRLVNGGTGNQLWSRVFTANPEGALQSQTAISRQVTQTVSDTLDDPEALLELERQSIPNEAYLHVLRGRKLNIQGSIDAYTKALDEFTMATLIAPHYLDAHAELALNYLILAQEKALDPDIANKHAFDAIQKALAINPNHASALATSATYYLNTGQMALAETAYKKAIESEPDLYIALINYANMLRLQRRYDQSLTLYYKTIELYPKSSGANWAIGNILINLGRFDDANAHYESCASLLPNFNGCLAGLAYIQQLTNQNAEAKATVEKYLELSNKQDFWPQMNFAWHQYWVGEFNTSEAIYQSLIDKHGANISALNTISFIRWHQGKLDEWIAYLMSLEQLHTFPQGTSALALSTFLNNDCSASTQWLEKLYKEKPESFRNYELISNGISYAAALAHCYKQEGKNSQFAQQMTELGNVLAKLPLNSLQPTGFYLVQGQWLALSGETNKATEMVSRVYQQSSPVEWRIEKDPIFRANLPEAMFANR